MERQMEGTMTTFEHWNLDDLRNHQFNAEVFGELVWAVGSQQPAAVRTGQAEERNRNPQSRTQRPKFGQRPKADDPRRHDYDTLDAGA